MKTHATNSSRETRSVRRRRGERGAVFIEFLVLFPTIAALFLLSVYAFGFQMRRQANQESVRECAWAHASSGCSGTPPGCNVGGLGRVSDAELRAASGGAFAQVGSRLPFLAPTLGSLHGDSFEVGRDHRIDRPAAFGGSVTVSASFRTMCNTRVNEWDLVPLFRLVCNEHGRWCP